jgi:cation:H+ antiporter
VTTLLWSGVFVLSLAALVWASNVLIGAAERIGLALGMSPFIVGVVIVGIGTSFPELVSSVYAALTDATEIVIGNVLGSNITNILLVLGLAGVIAKECDVDHDVLHIDLPIVLASALMLGFMIYDGTFGRVDALISCAGCGIYIFSTLETSSADKDSAIRGERAGTGTWLRLLGALALIVVSAKYTVDSVVALSVAFDIGVEIIALSAVAFGTSLPEIAISLTAARQGKPELAVGNIMGSNVFNAFAVMGIPGLITPLAIPREVIIFPLPVSIAVTLLYIIITVDGKINRWEGWLLLLFYAYFIAHLYGLA